MVDRALRFIRDMPIESTASIWKALLNACRMHKNVDLRAYAAERVFELDPDDPGPHYLIPFPLSYALIVAAENMLPQKHSDGITKMEGHG